MIYRVNIEIFFVCTYLEKCLPLEINQTRRNVKLKTLVRDVHLQSCYLAVDDGTLYMNIILLYSSGLCDGILMGTTCSVISVFRLATS